jgi:four helix bundle protein
VAAARQYDLSKRTLGFAQAVVRFGKLVPMTVPNTILVRQLVRAGTSPGANYAEADEAVSRRDFRRIIGICKKEAKEAKYWIEVIVAAEPKLKDAARPLWLEARQLHLIFASIYRKVGDPQGKAEENAQGADTAVAGQSTTLDDESNCDDQ